MKRNKNSVIGVFTLVIIFGIIFSMPLREYVKVTVVFGIPFILILGYMLKKPRYSFPWIVSVVLLLLVTVGYGFALSTLPDRIEVKTIILNATALEAEGNYTAAIEEYKKLEQYGKTRKMEERIASAKLEIEGQEILEEAREHIAKGNKTAAQELLESVPPHTKTAKEAKKLLKTLDK